jgi:hypothetical protein
MTGEKNGGKNSREKNKRGKKAHVVRVVGGTSKRQRDVEEEGRACVCVRVCACVCVREFKAPPGGQRGAGGR